mmetsp:Transcript_31906/g.83284  ORF Transcript_31906/g.83284 Transcript_31906/m.83284 type:complete len:632 (-) Transcript_31906:199-2094(-)
MVTSSKQPHQEIKKGVKNKIRKSQKLQERKDNGNEHQKDQSRDRKKGTKSKTRNVHYPVGVDHFSTLELGGYAFIDRTLYLKDVFASGFNHFLILRPRRSGKSLFLQMIESFVGIQNYLGKYKNVDFSSYEIGIRRKELLERQELLCEEEEVELLDLQKTWGYRSQHPTIYLSLYVPDPPSSDGGAADFIELIKQRISAIAEKYRAIIDRKALPKVLRRALRMLSNLRTDFPWHTGLYRLSEILAEYYGRKAVVLIDEYDSSLHFTLKGGMHSKVRSFLMNLLSLALKDNVHVEKSVVMGTTRFLKNGEFAPVFGFSEEEVRFLYKKKSVSNVQLADLKAKYNGYIVGDTRLYNPWSVMSCLEGKNVLNYWAGTGTVENIIEALRKDFSILSKLASVWKGESTVSIEIERLAAYPRSEESVLGGLFWAVLLQTGYLSLSEPYDGKGSTVDLKITNLEMKEAVRQILDGVGSVSCSASSKKLLQSFAASGNLGDLVSAIEDITLASSSKNLTREESYHNILFAMMYCTLTNWLVISEGESGHGFSDICLVPLADQQKTAVVIEIKHRKSSKATASKVPDLDTLAREALKQIEDKNYCFALKKYANVEEVLCLGIAFSHKSLKYAVKYNKIAT